MCHPKISMYVEKFSVGYQLVTVNKLPLIKKMMRDKKFLVLVNDLKYMKTQNDVNMIQKFRTNSKNMYSRPPVKRKA
jgi:hypothetical protein